MAIELFSFPTELIWRILSILAPRDICRCAITCRAFWNMIQNSVHIQYQLELYAQGFIKTTTMDSIDVSREMSSLKRSTSLWRSGLHLSTVLEERLMTSTFREYPSLPWLRSGMKCGLLWMLVQSGLFIRDYNTNTNLSRTWAIHDLSSQRRPNFLTVDPLQDLVVIVSLPGIITVTDTEQDYHAFWVECRSASSRHPHPDSVCASLEYKHTFDIRGVYHIDLIGEPAIYGDYIFVFYYIENKSYKRASATFMQVIDWRKGYVKSHLFPDYYQQGSEHWQFYVVDQRTIVAIGSSFITVHTLQDIDGSPRPRLTYLLPKCHHSSFPFMIVHASPSFSGTAPRADLMPDYVPSLESQIIVLELISHPRTLSIILVIDTVIFSGAALQSETHVKIPWSDWGPQYTCCFPHDPSYQISVFGSKMAYTLPRDHSPEPGQILEKLSTAGHFYIHIWDFNKRAITRSGNFYNPDSPNLLVRKPGGVVQSCFDEEIISNHPYTATVCRAPFLTHGLRELFLEQDRLILTSVQPGTVDIQVVSPVQMDVGSDFTH